MDMDRSVTELGHGGSEGFEIAVRGCSEFDRNVNVAHAQSGERGGLVGQGTRTVGKCQIDHGCDPGVAQRGELRFVRLARGGQRRRQPPEIVDADIVRRHTRIGIST